ncbi:MAG: helix-turn-helix domain-containing protein [Deltaproteobacteria bacterium]|nr:helix-turn-helix domain-containing protein [Kofleriaceae bacterium]
MTRPVTPSLDASDIELASPYAPYAAPSYALVDDELVASVGTDVRTRSLAAGIVAHRRRGGEGDAPAAARKGPAGHLTPDELRQIEEQHGEGITAVQIVDVFVSRGVRFSEASFRKYVQQGLLPRSRRVGRKGKNKGSLGVYPAKTVRRINEVKRLMGEGYTIEEIQEQFLLFTDLVENVDEAVTELLARLDEGVASERLDPQARRAVAKELGDVRRTAGELVERLGALARKVAAPRSALLRKSGAAGAAEDLL